MGACDGFRVLEFSDGACAASLCGQLFAGLGADVLKVETGAGDTLRQTAPLAPDGTAYGFHIANAAKESVLVEDGPGLEARLLELARSADVILIGQNLPAPLRRTTRQWNEALPDKVVCALTPFGEESARAGWLGNELINEAMGGLLICTGYPERPPVVSGIPYAEQMTALCGFTGILAALWERAESGQGQRLDVSVADMMVTVLGNFAPAYFLSGRSPRRIGNRHTIAAPWNLFPTADGHAVICVGGGDRSWWRDLAALIGHPELGDDDRFDRVFKRVERVEEVDALVSAWTRRHTTAEVVAEMERLKIPVGEVAPLEAVLAEPQYAKTRAMIGWTGAPEKAIAVPGLPFKVGTWNPPSRPGPALGSCRTWPERKMIPATEPRRPAGGDPRPLAGIRALEFGSRTSAPMAGRLLADLGADVVKIEPPKGESLRGSGQQVAGTSYLFHINNAGKESFVVEPKSPQGRELILRLAAKADVWFENLTPGSLDAIGIGYQDLKAVNPEIIYCSVSGFGRRSDYGNKKALDSVVQAMTGMMHLTGYPDHLPVKLGVSAADLAVAFCLTGSILAALHERRRTGKGQHVDLAMADVGVWLTQSLWPQIFAGTGSPQRQGNARSDACPYGLFATRDGYLAVAVEDDQQWSRFAALIGGELSEPKWQRSEARLRDRERIEAIVAAWAAERNATASAEELQRAGVPAAPTRNLDEILEDPESRRRDLIIELPHPAVGSMRLLGTPLNLSRTPARVSKHAPLLGENTAGVLNRWLRLPLTEVEALIASGAAFGRAPEKVDK